MIVIRATLKHVDELAFLFDQYRQFYNQPADYHACQTYLRQRLSNDESVIFIAQTEAGSIVGFTQLYHSFCSVALKPILYLYDLFVVESARREGVARTLMEAAKAYARLCQVDRLTLETAVDNVPAQTLYHSLGYEKDNDFYTYHLSMADKRV